MTLRIQIMSDLHISIWERAEGLGWFESFLEETHTDADVLILAGDIVGLSLSERPHAVKHLSMFAAQDKDVVYVPGNHEYYSTRISSHFLGQLEDETGVTILTAGVPTSIAGQAFLGDTMWQPHTGTFAELADDINDHRQIKDFRFTAPKRFKAFSSWLEKQLGSDDIVVTHHAPSFKSLSPEYNGDPCNRWFITPEMEPLIVERQPKLWVHGHTHAPFDYNIGKTRVICNPLGYPGESVKFNPKLVVEV